MLDLGPESREAAHLAAASCDLIQPLVQFVCEQDEKGGAENGRRKTVLVRFLVNLLGRPLSMLSQHPEVSKEGLEVQPATWATMDTACKLLIRLTSNLVTLEVEEEKGEEVESMGLPTLFYWVLGECQQKEVVFLHFFVGFIFQVIPQVYSHLHLLHIACPHICLLLSQTEEMRVHKGLILLCRWKTRVIVQILFQILTHLRRLEALPLSSLSSEEAENPTLTSLVVPLTKVLQSRKHTNNSIQITKELNRDESILDRGDHPPRREGGSPARFHLLSPPSLGFLSGGSLHSFPLPPQQYHTFRPSRMDSDSGL